MMNTYPIITNNQFGTITLEPSPPVEGLTRGRRPEWLRVKSPDSPKYQELRGLFRGKHLHTVCEEAMCPNIGECWGRGTATFMVRWFRDGELLSGTGVLSVEASAGQGDVAARVLTTWYDEDRDWLQVRARTAGEKSIAVYSDGKLVRELAFTVVPASEVDRLKGAQTEQLSARNHFRGVVRAVTVDGLLAQVEIDVTEPARVLAIITRESAEELGLKPGISAAGVVKATSVMVER